MADHAPRTVLCLASYEKGAGFLRECHHQGWRVLLLTTTALEHADWPREALHDIFYMPDLSDQMAVLHAVSYLARTHALDRVVALDDYDVEIAAAVREHLRLPGMGASQARLVRDKLAMRTRAHQQGIAVPDFVHLLNEAAIARFLEDVPPPWLLKPRSEVSTIGITRVSTPDEVWARRDALGDHASYHLLERYVHGAVYHVDSIIVDGVVLFAEVHQYARPPLDVYHDGGLAVTRTVARGAADEAALLGLNERVIQALGVRRGVTHMEFIRGQDDGRLYFLEVGARVGGAYIGDLVAAATGVDLWAEWARIETLADGRAYTPPTARHDYAAAIVSLARQEAPDTSGYTDAEIVVRVAKPHHVGFVLCSPDPARLSMLLDDYSHRIGQDFSAVLPPWMNRPPNPGTQPAPSG